MVLGNCLGERALPSPVLAIWHCSVRRFFNQNVNSFHRLSTILQVEY